MWALPSTEHRKNIHPPKIHNSRFHAVAASFLWRSHGGAPAKYNDVQTDLYLRRSIRQVHRRVTAKEMEAATAYVQKKRKLGSN